VNTARRHAVLALAAAVVLPVAGLATAAPSPDPRLAVNVGDLDPGFSPSGRPGVTDPLASQQFVDVALQSDGKVVAISDQGGDFFVARFNQDGSVDTGFGILGTGTAVIDVGGATKTDQAFAVAIDTQDRIIVAGRGGSDAGDFALVRLSRDGKATDINTHIHVGNVADTSAARDVALQSDGTIVLGGTAKVGGDTDFAVTRFAASTGAVIGAPSTVSLGTGDEAGRAVAVYPSGPNQDKIVVVGDTGTSADSAFGIVQWKPDASSDPSFNGTGLRVIDPTTGNDSARGVAITASGSILVAGRNGAADGDLVLAQLLPTGPLDGDFNLGSLRTLSRPGNEQPQTHPLAVQSDGRIVITADSNNSVDVGVFRLNANGSVDTTFGSGGVATFDVDSNDDANAVAVDPRGYLVVVGDDNTSAGFVARLFGSPDSDDDGVLDPVDACPLVTGKRPNGCPEAQLKGTKVYIQTLLSKSKASAKCPAKATVVVTTRTKDGKLTVSKKLKTTASGSGCALAGKVKLGAKPKKSAKTKVKITGTKLKTKRLVAVRL